MSRKRYTPEQIISMLREAELQAPVQALRYQRALLEAVDALERQRRESRLATAPPSSPACSRAASGEVQHQHKPTRIVRSNQVKKLKDQKRILA